MRVSYNDFFLRMWEAFGDPDVEPVAEYKFDARRRWRFDFAWPGHRVAVEIDGGQWLQGGGRHNADADRWKLNAAAAQGWLVLRFSPGMLEHDPRGCVRLVKQALKLNSDGGDDERGISAKN